MTLIAASSRPTHTPEDLALIDRYWRAAKQFGAKMAK